MSTKVIFIDEEFDEAKAEKNEDGLLDGSDYDGLGEEPKDIKVEL